ncbi:MAG: PH domain-containing protein, partial [Rubripirellula sp.]
ILVCALSLVGIGIPVLVIWFFRCRSTELTVTDLRTRLHRGWLSRSITEVWHRDVRNVQIEQTFFQRILGVGSIGVSSAAQSSIEIEVSGMRDVDKIKGIIDKNRISSRRAA